MKTSHWLIMLSMFTINGYGSSNPILKSIMDPTIYLSDVELDSIFDLVIKDDSIKNYYSGMFYFIQGLLRKKDMGTKVNISKKIEQEIIKDLSISKRDLRKMAYNAAVTFNIDSTKEIAIKQALGSYSDEYRGDAIAALLRIGGNDLGNVFLKLLNMYSRNWFDGNFQMILSGVAVYTDSTALVPLETLHSNAIELLNKENDSYWKRRYSEVVFMIACTINNLKSRLSKPVTANSFLNLKKDGFRNREAISAYSIFGRKLSQKGIKRSSQQILIINGKTFLNRL